VSSPIPKSAPTKREALRLLLADGKWHHMSECSRVGGTRYGARLLELRQGLGGPKMQTQHRVIDGSDNEFEYRAFVEPQAELELNAKTRSPKRLIAELIQENASLKRRVAELEGAGASA